ncbi:Holliday junction resolvase RuvX [Numidum massiliense]|uniref:Holliday junction resolvase RuvX n=1 Tax=Numidum massiliense TaxID=1522315 RepID=UPI0006D560CF|nr:Holliday junction resolvase RuvX [Numidum massiliense]
MRIIGLDVGEKTIGVALSDGLGLTAQGVEVIRRASRAQDIARLQELIEANDVSQIVVGLPKNMDGSIGARAQTCQSFALEMEKALGLPVILWDERLTTVAAERTLLSADVSRKKRKQVIDKLAASLILQAFLDAQRRNTHA